MKRKPGYLLIGIVVVIGLFWGVTSWVRRDKPINLLLITLDTTRADRLGCYGYQRALTPTLDRLAHRGVVFERAYAPVPLTLPSHASMLTGLYPPEHGLHNNGQSALPAGLPTLATELQAAGYETGAFVAAFVLEKKFGLSRGFSTYDDDLSRADGVRFLNPECFEPRGSHNISRGGAVIPQSTRVIAAARRFGFRYRVTRRSPRL